MVGKRVRWHVEATPREVKGSPGLLLRSDVLYVMDPMSRSFVAVPEPVSTEEPSPACRMDAGHLGYDISAPPRLTAGGRLLSASITEYHSLEKVYHLHAEVVVDPGSWMVRRVRSFTPPVRCYPHGVWLSADGGRLASARREITGDSYLDVVEVVLADDGTQLWRDQRPVWAVQWTAQGQLLVGYSSWTVALYDISTEGARLMWQRFSLELVGQVSLSPDQSRLLVTTSRSGHASHTVHVLDVASNELTPLDPRRANGREVDGRGEVEILGWVDDARVLTSSIRARSTVLSVMEVKTGHRYELFTVTGGDYLQASMALMPPQYWWQFLDSADAAAITGIPSAPEPEPAHAETAALDSDDVPPIAYPAGLAWAPLADLLTAYYDSNRRPPVAPITRAWHDGLRADFPPDSSNGISCDPATLAPFDYQSDLMTPIQFRISHPDPDAIVACLDAANERFLAIDEDGEEWQPGQEPPSDTAMLGWFHPARHDETTTLIMLDAGGAPYPWMMRTLLHILVAVLNDSGISGARIKP